MKIVFTGGGTGGHILPIIAIVRELKSTYKDTDLELFYMGPEDKFGDVLLSQEGVQTFNVPAGKLRRYWGFAAFFQNLADLFIWIPLGIAKALKVLFFISPDLIFSKGGYGAIPATVAGRLFLRIPVFLHESDIVPGKANLAAQRFALEVFTSFPQTRNFPPKKVLLVGNPIRTRLLSGSVQEAHQLFQLVGGKPVLLILGGSQGAKRVNDMLLSVLNDALSQFEIIHQTGYANFKEAEEEAAVAAAEENLPYYHPIPFLNENEIRHAYAAADFIVSRAGSGTIFEIAALGKPSILVPLPESAQNHQVENAYAYAQTGAALVLEEPNVKPHFFLERIRNIIFAQEEMAHMSKAALQFAKPEAARIIANYI
ncbi:MAG TPA: UDP-N-acetylglucosamine--N-acetylmuramyl-(pentapeptide) pyrophosphoryl-undecaprenol N-acetylglucosamine transferase, partial [Candidatus Paceibacterota bacterium]|nr:UDP-N-acetylglucosamine--N-acetylmuramyl-(pentapeptide) pyrophosphoryl-undecaprenol N-acetylglucosamine transferase [Candidatus Paceibacterota bacterium]